MERHTGFARPSRLLCGILTIVIIHVHAAAATHDPPAETQRDSEIALREAIDAWRYGALWRLWEMGTRATRAVLPQSDFTERMRRGNTAPANERTDSIRLLSHAEGTAILEARFSVHHTRQVKSGLIERPFLLRLEDGAWRVNLWDFVGLTAFFPPDALPGPLAPSPHGGRTKAK